MGSENNTDWEEIAKHAAREIEELKVDAKRYRWLRDRMVYADFDYDGLQVLVFEMPENFVSNSSCDKTIDSAMEMS